MTAFRAFQLPPGTRGFETAEIQAKGHLRARFSRAGGEALLRSLRRARATLCGRTSRDLAQSIGEVGRRFTEPGDPLRREAELKLPSEAGISPSMASLIIDGMARDWTPEPLERLLLADFQDPGILDNFRPDVEGQLSKAVGGSLAFHIGAGNLPGIGTTSIIRSLLVKCPVLLKPGRGDVTLPCLFVQALLESDPELAKAVAVVYWARGEGSDLEELAIHEADRVVAYGGTDLVRELRTRLPPTTPLVAYHHRLSIGAVAREHLDTLAQAEAVARKAARSVATFDQRGCVSPQIIWVEEGAPTKPVTWAKLLATELEVLAQEMPAGPIDKTVAAALQQLKATAELKGLAGMGDRVFGDAAGKGIVFFDPKTSGVTSLAGTGRTVVVKPIADLSQLSEVIRPASRTLQTLALDAPELRRRELEDPLATSGITRITTFKKQPWPAAWWRHDGTGPLQALVSWVVLEEND